MLAPLKTHTTTARVVAIAATAGAALMTTTGGADAEDVVSAKQQFGMVIAGSEQRSAAYGFYTKGCLAGGVQLPSDGQAWQAMRPSRNRAWGHPNLIEYVKWLADEAREKDGWPGLLVGDLAQPRGGPMLSGHRSHQVGLDADIWLTPMPDRRFSPQEREETSAVSMLASKTSVDPQVFTPAHVRLLRRATTHPEVERIFVHPAIKKALCEAAGDDKTWLAKIRPFWGHHYHFHVRLRCPQGQRGCRSQAAPPTDHRCGKEIRDWIALLTRPAPKPTTPTQPARRRAPMTIAALPQACRTVLEDGKPAIARGRVAPEQVTHLPPRRPR